MNEKIRKMFSIETGFRLKNIIEFFKPTCIALKKDEKKIMFLDAASYNNLGDQAISYAMSLFLKSEFNDYKYIEVSERKIIRNIKYIKRKINNDDIICLSGGGNMGNLYPRYEAIRRIIIKAFPNNKIIIFPQTIDYEADKYGKKELNRSKRIYNKHKKLVVCAREEKSYKIMKDIYNNVILVPDIVLFLINKINIEKKSTNNVGVCLRNDKESIIDINNKKEIEKISNKKNISTLSNEKFIDCKNRKDIIYNKLKEFNDCKYVITDRLHGMIFSSIVNTPCIAIDNSNKKVSGVYEVAKDSLKNVKLYDKNKEKINSLIRTMENSEIQECNDADFEKLINAIRKDTI